MTNLDAWRERECVVCGTMFKPKTQSRRDADRAKCCGHSCAARRGAAAAREQGAIVPRKPMSIEAYLGGAHCPRCSLRGEHECLGPIEDYMRSGESAV